MEGGIDYKGNWGVFWMTELFCILIVVVIHMIICVNSHNSMLANLNFIGCKLNLNFSKKVYL
jgi:hypothetical protein